MAPPEFKPLTIVPIQFSLTEGTNIPAPPDSPPHTPRPPTSDGGPLTSHPTTPNGSSKMPGAFPPSPALEPVLETIMNDKLPTSPQNTHSNGNGYLSPATSPIVGKKRPSSVRRLLSLRSIRGEKDKHQKYGTLNGGASSNFDPSTRPGSPYTVMSNDSTFSGGSTQKKRNSAWFGSSSKRKSGFFTGKIDEDVMEHEGGAVQPPAPRGPPPPTLPEFQQFGSLDGALDSNLGAEDMFKDIK
ncbi:hypothetical protein FKW77_006115 [Venturia effusa]|uniref:Uncharacterized protein n=1 Tax=Venturia effusa TaxID=50376 RepID=A0A517LIW4_9PEZI|nr:hypothetical protein FKW77_006115 [Venturia effusa]